MNIDTLSPGETVSLVRVPPDIDQSEAVANRG